jgi:hypothetical protein
MFRQSYLQLPETERHALLEGIAQSNPSFTLKSFAQFDLYGLSTPSAIYDHHGLEFVFVPGDTVTLGWSSFSEAISNVELSERGWSSIEKFTDFLRVYMSPVREVTIGPMLVERRPKELGWREVDGDSTEFRSVFGGELPPIHDGPSRVLMGFNRFKIIFGRGQRLCFLYKAMTYDELIERFESEGFRLPTEDEFEYLCGGGKRTLYRWGELLLSECAHQFGIPKEGTAIDPSDGEERDPFWLSDANFFGVSICFDPYKVELLQDSPVLGKGGDGGVAMCGGEGQFQAFLPYATFYRDPFGSPSRDDVAGDYTVARKIKRL